jgi:hypothetical protein
MLGDRHFERGKLADLRFGDARADGAVDHRDRQMPEKIDHPRMRARMARGEKLVQQRLDLGPHALERAHGREERG